MASWKIYSYPNNPRVWKSLIAAEYVGVNIETPAFKIGTDNKSKEFMAKNPVGKVPVLETPEGFVWESNAIARFVARQGKDGAVIYGKSAYQDALIDQWMDFAVNELELPSAAWLFPILNIVPYHKEATNKAKGDIRKALSVLNRHLATRTFLVGQRISLADIVVTMVLYRLYKMVFDPGFRKSFQNVNRWYTTCVNQVQFKKVIGDVKLCEKMMVADPNAAPPKKKEEKKPAAKPQQQKKKKKAKNPLELLPPTKFNLDTWKKTYSNAKVTKTGAMPWFWENFDAEGWSIYFADYKYNEEFEELFKVSNLIGGFIQRLDKLRKWGFGVVLIFGDVDKSDYYVSSCWLWRGQDVPQEMLDNPMAEHWTFRKADVATQKALIEDFWAWEGDFNGVEKKFLDEGKIFK